MFLKLILSLIFAVATIQSYTMLQQQKPAQNNKFKYKKNKNQVINAILGNPDTKPNTVSDQQQTTPTADVCIMTKPKAEQEVTIDTANDTDTATVTNQETDLVADVIQEPKKHERVCPLCGGPSAACEADRQRIAEGVMLPCACDDCC